VSRGPRATDKAIAKRNWIDLKRWMAVLSQLQLADAHGEKPQKKAAISRAVEFLALRGDKYTYDQVADSWRKIEKAHKSGLLVLTSSLAPSEAEFDDFCDDLPFEIRSNFRVDN